MEIPNWFIALSVALFVGSLIFDFALASRRPHDVSLREATKWVSFYVFLAGVFAVGLALVADGETALQFTAAYLTEYSLSADNLFVFMVIISSFAVPTVLQQRVLLFGVLIALVLRAVLIVLGVAVVNRFTVAFLFFGFFLIWTAFTVLREEDQADEESPTNPILSFAQRKFRTHPEYDGTRLFTQIGGVRHLTPLLLVMIAIGFTDLMFALDSIPAVLGLTTNSFLVITSNAFALMGLRQLYFLLHSLMKKLQHLAKGLAAVLAFIGLKLLLMGLDPLVDVDLPHVSTLVSLAVIVFILTVTTVWSLWESAE